MSTIDPEFQNDQDLWGSDQDLWDASIVYEKATSNTLYASGEYLILGNSKPYLNVQNPKGVIEHIQDSGSGTIFKKEFRYSVDSTSFSEFQELTTEALQALGPFQWVWFQFRYILLSGGPATISKVELDFVPVVADKFDGYVAPAIQDESRVYAFPVTYKSNFLWEPYKMNRAIRLYKDLNLMVNNLFGHETTYYRALPYGRSKDVTLMEYSLYEHDDGKCVKLVVPNNQFPDNKLNMGPFGVDFELPFEVEIDKDYFQKIFGDGTGPQKRDVIYFPRTNRIYEVSSSYLFRDFMNEPLYFKVSLIKWLPKSNAEPSETLSNLEEYTTSAGKLFNDLIEDEGVQVTNPQQYNVATTIDDPVRSFLSKEQTIINENVLNYYNVISEYHYKMEALAYENKLEVIIDSSLLKKDTTYYARFSPSSTQDDVQYYYSMKKMVYLGDNEYGKSVFRYEAGNSQLESYVNASQIFYPGSSLNLYLGEYAGESDAEVIVSCDVTGYASSYIPKVVRYKAPGTFTSATDRSFSAWFRNRDASTAKIKIDGNVSFDQYSNEIVIALDKKFLFFVGDSVIISRTSSSDFYIYGQIVSVIDEYNIVIKADQNIINYVSSSFPSWTSYTDLQVQKSLPRVFLDSIKDEKGIRIEMRGNRHFIITLNGTQTYFSIPSNTAGLENLKWYAVFVNFSNTFKQLTLNIWRTQWDPSTNLPATTDMRIVYNKTVPMAKGDYSSDEHYYLTPSSMDLTNIRLFNKTAETDKQSLLLNQNIVKDAQLAIIIDNALPQSKLPYVGYTR